MDCRWVACLLLVGCFSEPSSTGSGGDTGSSTGPSSTSTPSSTGTADATAEGSTSLFGSSTFDTFDPTTIGSTGGAPDCVADEACVMPPPPSWNGPVLGRVVEDALLDPMCPPGSSDVLRAGRDPGARCDCSGCSNEGIACDVNIEWGVNNVCDNTTTGTGCQPFDSDDSGLLSLSVDITEAEGSACTLPTPSEPRFVTRAVGCEPTGGPCEDGGTCILGRACIWQEGEHRCPPAFGVREVLYESFEAEELSCETCQCELSGLACSEVTVTPYGAASCAGDAVAASLDYFSFNDPVCESYFDPKQVVLADDVVSLDIQVGDVSCSSDQANTLAAGTFTTSSPLTLCCTD